MTPDPTVTRRSALAAGVGIAGISVLAACSSPSSPSSTSDPSAAGSAPSAGEDKSSSGTGSSAAAGSSGGSAATDDDNALATLSDVPVGGAISVKLPDGKPGIVGRPTATTAVCFSAICTHQGCTVKPEGKTLNCPCHGSKFNALTGAVVNPPAPSPLAKVDVAVRDGKVVAT